MKKTLLVLWILLALSVIGLSNTAIASLKHHNSELQTSYTPAEVNLNKAMRALWEDHVIYTHLYVISALGDQPNADILAKRLLRNQDDIGNAIKPYYGNAAGAKLTAILRDHILIAAEVVKAAKMNNSDDLKTSSKKWRDNAVELATFLSSANPNWSKDKIQKMLFMHLDLTTNNVVARLHKDWKKDIATFDEGEAFMLDFADTLSNGIIKQFPNKFKS